MGYFARRRARESAIPPGAVEGGLEDGSAGRRSQLFDSPAPAEAEQHPEPSAGAADLGQVGRLIRRTLEQGNVTVLAGEEVLDLEPAGLQGHAFEPVHLPEPEGDPHSE